MRHDLRDGDYDASMRNTRRRQSAAAAAAAEASNANESKPQTPAGITLSSSGKVACADHGADITGLLSKAGESGAYADVKIVCGSGSGSGGESTFWSHRLLLGAVSPFLRSLLADSEDGAALTLHLPQVDAKHLRLVLDYVYTGAMYLCADQLAGVVRVFEMLRMKCGVSVSKMVAVEEEKAGRVGGVGKRTRRKSAVEKRWVKEAEFNGFEQLKTDIKAELIDEEVTATEPIVASETPKQENETETANSNSWHDLRQQEEKPAQNSFAVEEMPVENEDTEPPVEVMPVTRTSSDEERRRMSRGRAIN